jgi:hypothetical protein
MDDTTRLQQLHDEDDLAAGAPATAAAASGNTNVRRTRNRIDNVNDNAASNNRTRQTTQSVERAERQRRREAQQERSAALSAGRSTRKPTPRTTGRTSVPISTTASSIDARSARSIPPAGSRWLMPGTSGTPPVTPHPSIPTSNSRPTLAGSMIDARQDDEASTFLFNSNSRFESPPGHFDIGTTANGLTASAQPITSTDAGISGRGWDRSGNNRTTVTEVDDQLDSARRIPDPLRPRRPEDQTMSRGAAEDHLRNMEPPSGSLSAPSSRRVAPLDLPSSFLRSNLSDDYVLPVDGSVGGGASTRIQTSGGHRSLHEQDHPVLSHNLLPVTNTGNQAGVPLYTDLPTSFDLQRLHDLSHLPQQRTNITQQSPAPPPYSEVVTGRERPDANYLSDSWQFEWDVSRPSLNPPARDASRPSLDPAASSGRYGREHEPSQQQSQSQVPQEDRQDMNRQARERADREQQEKRWQDSVQQHQEWLDRARRERDQWRRDQDNRDGEHRDRDRAGREEQERARQERDNGQELRERQDWEQREREQREREQREREQREREQKEREERDREQRERDQQYRDYREQREREERDRDRERQERERRDRERPAAASVDRRPAPAHIDIHQEQQQQRPGREQLDWEREQQQEADQHARNHLPVPAGRPAGDQQEGDNVMLQMLQEMRRGNDDSRTQMMQFIQQQQAQQQQQQENQQEQQDKKQAHYKLPVGLDKAAPPTWTTSEKSGDPAKYMDELEAYGATRHYTPDNMIEAMRLGIKGELGKVWLKEFQENREDGIVGQSWTEAKNSFIDVMRGPDYEAQLTAEWTACAMTDTETVTQFYLRFREIQTRIQYFQGLHARPAVHIKHFLNGLKPELASPLLSTDYVSLQVAWTKAKDQEKIQGRMGKGSAGTAPGVEKHSTRQKAKVLAIKDTAEPTPADQIPLTPPVAPTTSTSTSSTTQVQALTTTQNLQQQQQIQPYVPPPPTQTQPPYRQQSFRPPYRPQQYQQQQQYPQWGCYRCGEEDHYVANCPQPDRRVCFSCGEPGHYRSDCPQYPPSGYQRYGGYQGGGGGRGRGGGRGGGRGRGRGRGGERGEEEEQQDRQHIQQPPEPARQDARLNE